MALINGFLILLISLIVNSEVTISAYNLAKSLYHQQVLEMMKNEDFNELMKFVNKSIYRI